MAQPIRILHLITGLNTGGAELALARLVESMDRHEFDNRVVSLIKPGAVGNRIENSNIWLDSLGMPAGRVTINGFSKLMRLIRQFEPNILQTWLYHADLIGLVAGKILRIPKIAWNIRGSDSNFMNSQRISKIIARTCAIFSSWPDAVFVNSEAGIITHEEMGYHPKNWKLIQNGIDTTIFAPDKASGVKVREGLNIPSENNVVGLVARLDPQKGHNFFLRAAKIVLEEKHNTSFVCVGIGASKYTEEIKQQTKDYGLQNSVFWAGVRNDMPSVYNSFSCSVSASAFGEGFPNVIAEAMSCGIPCIVTRTGDSPRVLGDTGLIVPTQDYIALAEGILKILSLPSKLHSDLGIRARQRVIDNFSLGKMVEQYSESYRHLAHNEIN